MFLQQMN